MGSGFVAHNSCSGFKANPIWGLALWPIIAAVVSSLNQYGVFTVMIPLHGAADIIRRQMITHIHQITAVLLADREVHSDQK
jgi:hypothetical protein